MKIRNKMWLEPIEGYDPWKNSGEFTFNEKVARNTCQFFEDYFYHAKGEWAGRNFKLLRWQKKITGHLFGWFRKNGTRRYREMFLYVPKKNGKTAWAAGIALILMIADDEPGAEIYSASGDRDQAALIFEIASGFVDKNEMLKEHIKVLPGYKLMKFEETMSYWKVLSSESKTKHGPNIHGLILDELHIFPDNELIDTLQRGTISRRQPMTIYLTTADYAKPSPCNTLLDYAKKIRDGIVDNKFFLPVIYEADAEKDDWTDEKTWKAVNPSYGVTIKRDYFVAETQKAKEEPSKENSFKRLHLNIQTKQEKKWMDIKDWDASGQKINQNELLGMKCYGGVDLSSTTDICAYGLFFPDNDAFLVWFWVPEKTISRRIEYELWANDGYIEIITGPVINHEIIRKKIVETSREYKIIDIAYDPWNASQLTMRLSDDDNIPMLEFRQGYKSMNEPTKSLEKLILNRSLTHFGNPVLRWMCSNVIAVNDPAGNVKLAKPNKDSPLKVDGMIALVMAYGASMSGNEHENSNVYNERGMIDLMDYVK